MATGWSHDFTEFQGGGAVEVEGVSGRLKGLKETELHTSVC